MIKYFKNYLKLFSMKAKINAWFRTAMVLLGESLKLRAM